MRGSESVGVEPGIELYLVRWTGGGASVGCGRAALDGIDWLANGVRQATGHFAT